MQIEIKLMAQPIRPRGDLPKDLIGSIGALVEFSGIVRGEEDGQQIAALAYEAYPAMAHQVMKDIIEDIGRRHPCFWVQVTHRLGNVPVGEAAIHIMVAARHRAEAFAMLHEFMDRLKQDAPIWKRPAPTAAEGAHPRQP